MHKILDPMNWFFCKYTIVNQLRPTDTLEKREVFWATQEGIRRSLTEKMAGDIYTFSNGKYIPLIIELNISELKEEGEATTRNDIYDRVLSGVSDKRYGYRITYKKNPKKA